MTQSQGLQRLERVGVGGIFHVLLQDGTSEEYQKPALYVLVTKDVEGRVIHLWGYRISYVTQGLLVEKLPPVGGLERAVLLHQQFAWNHPNVPRTGAQVAALQADIEGQVDRQQFYNFLGVAAADPAKRTQLYAVTGNATKYDFGRDGTLSDRLKNRIEELFIQSRGAQSLGL